MNLNFFNKKNNNDYFLGIFLKEQKGIIILMKKENGEIFIQDRINFAYTNAWENLIEDIDENLYQLEEKNKVTVSKTIFFVYSHLVDEITKNIKAPYLKKIKELVKNLNLEALGYIECYEAIFSYLEKKEQSSLNSTIIEIDNKEISVFVYQGSRLVYKNTLARTDNIIDDFIVSVSNLKDKNILLPSRIIIYDSDNLEQEVNKLISYRWDKDYFIQIPKIEILKEEEVIEALIKVFSNQIKESSENIKNTKENFGFVVGEDIENIKKEKKLINIKNFFSKIKFPKVSFNFFKIDLVSFINSKFIIFFGFILFSLSLFINEYFFHKASLTIYLPSENIEKKIKSDIEYKISTSTAKFSETISTTGKKEIGEKAKGSIIIHNFDDKEITLNKGTVVESSGLKFLLENDIKVASATLTADASAKLPGKKEVEIIAENIGSGGNLAKGTRFKISGFSENLCFGINEKSLTGGSKKEIKTVSSSDLINLENKVLEKAKKEKINFKLSKDEKIIDNLTEYKIVDKKFSKEIGEEASSLTLDSTISISYYIYSRDKIINSIIKELSKDLRDNFILSKDNVNFKISNIEKKNNKIEAILEAKGKSVLNFNDKKAVKLILGKSKDKIKDILKSNFNIQGYELTITKSIPFFDNFLPFFDKNINLKISYL